MHNAKGRKAPRSIFEVVLAMAFLLSSALLFYFEASFIHSMHALNGYAWVDPNQKISLPIVDELISRVWPIFLLGSLLALSGIGLLKCYQWSRWLSAALLSVAAVSLNIWMFGGEWQWFTHPHPNVYQQDHGFEHYMVVAAWVSSLIMVLLDVLAYWMVWTLTRRARSNKGSGSFTPV